MQLVEMKEEESNDPQISYTIFEQLRLWNKNTINGRQEHAVCSSNTKGPVWLEDSKGGGGEKGIVSHIGP